MATFPCPACATPITLSGAARKGRCRKCGAWAEGPAGAVPPPPRPPRGAPGASPGAGLPDGPRAHHYLFAHTLLPQIAFAEPGKFLGLRTSTVEQAWAFIATQLPPGAETLSPAGLEAWREEYGDAHLLLGVQLPAPQRITEAWFVAGYLWPLGQTGLLRRKEAVGWRYFTLERSIDLARGGAESTVLGEWAPEEGRLRHLNHGPGPLPPDRAAFVSALRALAHEKG